jgi:hypothetical protein
MRYSSIHILIFLIFFHNISAQEIPELRVQEIYQNIISSIGNSFPPAPALNIIDSKNKVAYMTNNGIFLEKKTIEALNRGDHFEDKIAYIISHELAHHYLNHNWMFNSGLGYTSEIGKYIDENSVDTNQRKLAESQADLFGGFFGQIAGYNVLGYGQEVLTLIYEEYKIPNVIKGYPSLEERKQIIVSKKEEADKLKVFFDLGVVSFNLERYDLSGILFSEILKNNFTSREIFNNLGLSYLLQAIRSTSEYNRFIYPVYLDNQTRLSTSTTRSSNISSDILKLLNDSELNLKKAIELDPYYLPSIQNLYVLRFLKEEKQRDEILKEILFDSRIDEKTKVDFEVLYMLFNDEKIKKISKKALNGSLVSKENLKSKEELTLKNNIDLKIISEKLAIDESNFLFGFDSPYSIMRSNYSRFRVQLKEFEETKVYKIDEIYFIQSISSSLNEDDLKNLNFLKRGDFYYFILDDFN